MSTRATLTFNIWALITIETLVMSKCKVKTDIFSIFHDQMGMGQMKMLSWKLLLWCWLLLFNFQSWKNSSTMKWDFWHNATQPGADIENRRENERQRSSTHSSHVKDSSVHDDERITFPTLSSSLGKLIKFPQYSWHVLSNTWELKTVNSQRNLTSL